MEAKSIICPLCQHGEMELKEIPTKKPNGRGSKSYLWICEECPGILIEWWDDQDTEAFNRYINYEEYPQKTLAFFDIYNKYRHLISEMDELEKVIESLLPGPTASSPNWVEKAKQSKSRAVQLLFKEYKVLYDKAAGMTEKYYLEVPNETNRNN